MPGSGAAAASILADHVPVVIGALHRPAPIHALWPLHVIWNGVGSKPGPVTVPTAVKVKDSEPLLVNAPNVSMVKVNPSYAKTVCPGIPITKSNASVPGLGRQEPGPKLPVQACASAVVPDPSKLSEKVIRPLMNAA